MQDEENVSWRLWKSCWGGWDTKIDCGSWRRWNRTLYIAGMIWINAFLLPGMSLSGSSAIPLQALAVVSLLFIWLYHGQQGYHSRAWSRLCYWFYPLHLVILILLFHFFLL